MKIKYVNSRKPIKAQGTGSLPRVALFFFLIGIIMIASQARLWGLTQTQEEEIRKDAANFKYNTVTTKEGLKLKHMVLLLQASQ